jgi:hypothetical protein
MCVPDHLALQPEIFVKSVNLAWYGLSELKQKPQLVTRER